LNEECHLEQEGYFSRMKSDRMEEPGRRYRSPPRNEDRTKRSRTPPPSRRKVSKSPPRRRYESPDRNPDPPPSQRSRKEPWQDLIGSDSEGDDNKFVRERDASREREHRRRHQQAECVRRAGALSRNMQESAKQGLDTNYQSGPRLFWDGFQWVAKAPEGSQGGDPAMMNQTRRLRRLYFGNLPLNYGLTETAFQEIVWQEMLKRGYVKDRNTCPVICVWFAKDKGTYGFVEFATVEETDLALGLDGMEVMGASIKVNRPNDYATNNAGPGGQPHAVVPNLALINNVDPAKASSTFVLLKGIIQPQDLDEDETWADCLEDIEEGVSQYGQVRASLIISPELMKTADAQGVNAPAKIGDVVLEFETPAVADQCVAGMTQKRYNQRAVQADKLTSEVFGLIAPMVGIAKGMDVGLFREGGSTSAA